VEFDQCRFGRHSDATLEFNERRLRLSEMVTRVAISSYSGCAPQWKSNMNQRQQWIDLLIVAMPAPPT
jgi:hypothetical protein